MRRGGSISPHTTLHTYIYTKHEHYCWPSSDDASTTPTPTPQQRPPRKNGLWEGPRLRHRAGKMIPHTTHTPAPPPNETKHKNHTTDHRRPRRRLFGQEPRCAEPAGGPVFHAQRRQPPYRDVLLLLPRPHGAPDHGARLSTDTGGGGGIMPNTTHPQHTLIFPNRCPRSSPAAAWPPPPLPRSSGSAPRSEPSAFAYDEGVWSLVMHKYNMKSIPPISYHTA